MIAFDKPVRRQQSESNAQVRFLAMLPQIRRQALIAFRTAKPEAKEELVAETVANAYCAFGRLVERGRQDLAYPTPLALYAIRQIRAGRRVGAKFSIRDVNCRYAQFKRGIVVERLDRFDSRRGEWREVLVEDRSAGPAETAAARMDFATWLASLPSKKRQIAEALATGETTGNAARLFGCSAANISQLRDQFKRSWSAFQGESMGV